MKNTSTQIINLLLIALITLLNTTFAQTTENSMFDPVLLSKAKAMANKIFLIDSHSHDLFKPKGRKFPKQIDYSMFKNSGINGIVHSYPISQRKNDDPKSYTINEINEFHQIKDKPISFINSSEEFLKNTNEENVKVLLGLEYFHGLFDGDENTLNEYYDLGIRTVTLFSGGKDTLFTKKDDNYFLTGFGKKLVHKMNSLGIACDLSHLPDMIQNEIINLSNSPVFVSHSNVREVVNASFNISKQNLNQLFEKGGILCLTFFSEYVSKESYASRETIKNPFERPRASIEEFVDHIDYIKDNYGIDYISIGSDYGGTGRFAPKGLETIEGFPLIIYHLLKRNYTEDEIRKVMGLNFINYLARVEKVAKV